MGSLWGRSGSLWIVVGRCGVVVGRWGSLLVVVDRSSSSSSKTLFKHASLITHG